MNGHLSCLQYARATGFSWDKETCYIAAKYGHLSCLQYARENGCPWDKQTYHYAAKYGHLSCLQYARENGCPWDKSKYQAAKDLERLRPTPAAKEIFEYVVKNECPME